MKKLMKRYLKNQRGLTLVELLAVIVILGIIAAIAVPAIGSIIDNSRRDAHVANAKIIADAARMYLTANPAEVPAADGTSSISLEKLQQAGFVGIIAVPGGTDNYTPSKTKVDVKADKSGKLYSYYVTLMATPDNSKAFIDNKDVAVVKRADVDLDRSGTADGVN